MSNPTTPFNWQMPTNTDLVTDLPADFEVFGQAVATSMADLLGGTTGQILSKATNADMDFTWITNDIGDITAVTAGTGLSGGGTSGAVSLAIDTAVTVDKTTSQTLTNKTLTAPVINGGLINLSFNAQTGTTYTLVAADSGKLVTASNASPITVTIPPSVFAAGEQINLQQIGAGQVTFAAGAGVTITSTGSTAAAPKITARYGAATIICTASNVFTIIGGLS
jgi:hypothetical protein